jgi:PhzF family phenazine biosynthesis protein
MPPGSLIFKVDSFTDVPFRGNPAGVCLLDEEVGDDWMQAVAAEMNVAETAFLRSTGEGYSIRYFTPVAEVPLCGHATLASAHVLWEERREPEDVTIGFQSKSGRLSSAREEGWILLDFPADPPAPDEAPEGLYGALGAAARRAYRSPRLGILVLEYHSEEEVRSMKPDFHNVRAGGFGLVSVTAPSSTPDRDYVVRVFAPEIGIDEDPVTGAAQTCLGPLWAERLGKEEIVAHQISARGGVVRVRTRGDRVDLLGKAVTVLRGELAV